MPPKAKFTRKQIISAALEIVRHSGSEALTARELGKTLGSSARPIFTVFKNMDEVSDEVISAARALYNKYAEKGLSMKPAFKWFGIQSIRFASEEPKLFRLLFMRERETVLRRSELPDMIGDYYSRIIDIICGDFHIDRQTAEQLYLHLWAYVHGIAVLCATRVCSFTQDEADEMLSTAFRSFMAGMKIAPDNRLSEN